ncbi:hypothetical protein BKA70DRAFT_1443191 [Coprinopsis sp. MPI-PUGE-AT-0042]|nr:hypothetical protein BKA70DRAFT_1443191 [Coprinopsis sp. MPI-PUGE-AT-0042]
MVTNHITYRHRRASQKHDIRNKKHHVKTTAKSTSRGIVLQTVSQTPKRVIGRLSFSPRKRRRTLPTLTPVDDDDDESTDGDHAEQYTPFVLPSKGTYSQNDFMNDWVDVKDVFLEEILNRERPLLDMHCEQCSSQDSLWRCLDCFSCPTLCVTCIRSGHRSLPFHRVEIWQHTHFEPSWLWKTGLVVHLGHRGEPCPTPTSLDTSDAEHPFCAVDPAEFEWEVAEDHFTTDFSHGARPPSRSMNGGKVLIVLHTNGVHHTIFRLCSCPGAHAEFRQLLAHGLYPASLKNVRTVATFPLLDDHHMSTVECHTSTYSFYNRLCRVTNKAFPQTVPDRYRELGRMGRQWLHLKELKWFGFGHSEQEPGPGSLALFCAGCPQPGVNITMQEWKALTDVPKVRTFVVDGNFSAVHQRQRANDEDVWLKKGYSFMTERHKYQSHLEVALESKQKPNCHDHRAIADRWKGMKGCDATGIGSVACMRHGCFVPCATVDFQKGERQMNIDYAFVQALQHSTVPRGTKIVLCYDVNCQYCINFRKRCQQSSALAEAQHYPITFAIGLWHVHGHRPECYPRHAPSFVHGAARKSGEILESLWDTLNPTTGCTRTMTNAHRVEVLDAVMADSNWKKLTGLVVSIARDVVRARIEAGASADEFDAIDATISAEHRDLWTGQTAKAQRTRSKNPKSMDIFSSTMEAPPSRVRVELELMNTERALGRGKGIARWISLGIKIQEQQCHLIAFARLHHRYATDLQLLTISRRRTQILDSIVEFEKLGASLFPTLDFSSFTTDFVPLSDHLELDDDSDTDDEVHQSSFRPTTTQTRREPEYLAISLPSSINPLPIPMKDAAETEVKLRIAQANNELEELRDQIGRLSFMYRGVLRPAKTKVAKTRANHLLAAANRKKRLHARLYNQAQWALTRLHAPLRVRTTYIPIVGADLAVSTAIAEPNASGQSTESLSWIWSVRPLGMEPGDQGTGDDVGQVDEANNLHSSQSNPPQRSKHLDEIYRVNWMRAREKAARWDEEYAFLWHEMTWVPTFFESRSTAWRELTSRQQSLGLGHDAYAFKQAALWKSLATHARSTFEQLQSELTAEDSQPIATDGHVGHEGGDSGDEGLLHTTERSTASTSTESSSSSEGVSSE